MIIEGIIFDCDGTLVDSETLAHATLSDYVAELGLRITPHEALTAFRGRKLDECVAELEVRFGRPLPGHFIPEFRERMAAAFRRELRPIEGALELVGSLTLPFCVASSAPREKIMLSLSLTGLLPWFEERIFSSYEVGAWKPSPGLFLHAAREMGVEPSRCAVIEDSLPGLLAGLAAGMTVVALNPEGCDEVVLRRTHVIRHLSEVNAVLGLRSSVHNRS